MTLRRFLVAAAYLPVRRDRSRGRVALHVLAATGVHRRPVDVGARSSRGSLYRSLVLAAALMGRPAIAVLRADRTAALLADAWVGHGLSPGFQALGFAAVPLLPATIAFAPAAAGIGAPVR